MAVTPFDSTLLGGLLSEPMAANLFSDPVELTYMIRVEAALARAQGRLGVIPPKLAPRLADALEQVDIEPEALAEGTASAGVSIPALVTALRQAVGPELGEHLHWGATSQDIADTGLMLRLRAALNLIDARLEACATPLAALADAHRATPMAARTRTQHATPTCFGLKAANWLAPLSRLSERLEALRKRALAVQFGGAAGNLSALGERGPEVAAALAEELELSPAAPWHAQRDRIEEIASWLTALTGALGKIGLDLMQLAQTEIAEIRFETAGGSSTMPQKQNPVDAEALVALARFNATQMSSIHHAALHAQERDGAAWTGEWLALPAMVVAAATSIDRAAGLLASLEPDAARMLANLEAGGGLIYAEAASFALAKRMPRAEAQALVKRVALEVRGTGRTLLDALAEAAGDDTALAALADPTAHFGAADALIDGIITEARKRFPAIPPIKRRRVSKGS